MAGGIFANRLVEGLLQGQSVPNFHYPKEELDEFIAKMIEKKKLRIRQQLGL